MSLHKNTVPSTPDRKTLFAISAECGADPRTVSYCFTGHRKTSQVARAAIEAACAKLGVPLPAVTP